MEVTMPEIPTTTAASRDQAPERVPARQPEGTERTRNRIVYAPRMDIVEHEDTLEILAVLFGADR
jgi:hypothetical protein